MQCAKRSANAAQAASRNSGFSVFHHVFVVMASSTLEITASKMVTDTANFWFHPCHFSKHFVVGCAHRINFIPGTE